MPEPKVDARPAVRPPGAPAPEHHRDITGGQARAAVFGISDGLLTNVSLILGVAGANPGPGVVRLAGVAGLVAGAFSMAAGEYVSVSAQSELIQRELTVERRALERTPETERRELVGLYVRRGLAREMAEQVAGAIHKNPQTALEVHAREELGVDPDQTGSPVGAALSSFGAFAFGAAVPLIPWFFGSGLLAVGLSIGLAAILATAIGVVLATFTEGSKLRSAARQLGIAIIAAAVTFAVGRLVGGATSVG